MQKIVLLILFQISPIIFATEYDLTDEQVKSLEAGSFYQISIDNIACDDTIKAKDNVFPAILFLKLKFVFLKLKFDLYDKCDIQWQERVTECKKSSDIWYCPLVERIVYEESSISDLSERMRTRAENLLPSASSPNKQNITTIKNRVDNYNLNTQYWKYKQHSICTDCDEKLFADTFQSLETYKGIKNPKTDVKNSLFDKVKKGFCHQQPNSDTISPTEYLWGQLNDYQPIFNVNNNFMTLIDSYNQLCVEGATR